MAHPSPIPLLRAVLLAATASLLALSPLDAAFQLLPARALGGAESTKRPLPLSLSTWRDGTFAQAFEAYYAQHFGGRPWLISLANQLRFSLFGVIPRTSGTPVTLGTDHWLYENAYLHDYLGDTGAPPPEAGDDALPSLRALADFCAAHDVAFVLLVTPSKPHIYPEHLPSALQSPATTPRARDVLLPQLRAAGLPLVDAHELFRAWKAEPDAPLLFAPTGTHWTYDAAWRTLLVALQTARPPKPFQPPAHHRETHFPEQPDRDLCALINLFRFDAPDEAQVPYPVFDPLPPDSHWPRTRIGLLGDSFCHSLADLLSRSGLDHPTEYLYYGRRFHQSSPRGLNHAAPMQAGDPIDWSSFDFPAWLRSLDLFILECNEIQLLDPWWWLHAAPTTPAS
ncbi:MAG: hypothetical protein ILO10_07435 [Kiritimatiellae bacterium]|nr:hypothetical protein [Kiritimatiellia bacterium]